MRVRPPVVRKIFVTGPWREPEYALYAVALFLGYIGIYIPYFYIQLYCLEKNIVTGNLNTYLIPLINAGGFFGRIVRYSRPSLNQLSAY